ncbi:hypothetical protein [Kordiimonas laminariae]|uniref:hypothetical protein n=1 Tax=Kordiimonas laminariae TaxID=2917717 RepID=UPI001FF5B2BF|nr:hypothetical protein [Kordiimonas laminariae]MCK0071205.1 hypothetical protein [Kordiimonas laminariae]
MQITLDLNWSEDGQLILEQVLPCNTAEKNLDMYRVIDQNHSEYTKHRHSVKTAINFSALPKTFKDEFDNFCSTHKMVSKEVLIEAMRLIGQQYDHEGLATYPRWRDLTSRPLNRYRDYYNIRSTSYDSSSG